MADYGCVENGGFNAPTKQYKMKPSLELYLRLRREDPDAEIEVGVIGGFDQLLFMESELRRHGFDPGLVASAMDANEEAMCELSLQIMEKIIAARALVKSGKTHLSRRNLAIPDKLIDWLITCMLDAMSYYDDLEIPRDLIVLIRERLGGSNPAYEQASFARERRMSAIMIGGQLKARGVEPTFRMLAKMLKVAPSTVMRWFPNGDFEAEIDRVSRWFDGNGQLLPLDQGIGPALRKK